MVAKPMAGGYQRTSLMRLKVAFGHTQRCFDTWGVVCSVSGSQNTSRMQSEVTGHVLEASSEAGNDLWKAGGPGMADGNCDGRTDFIIHWGARMDPLWILRTHCV